MTKRRWAMVEREMKLVRAIAYRVARRLPVSIDVEDLVSIGTLALISAAQQFDRSRGVGFGAFARFRVRGAMLDSMRKGNYEFELHLQVEDDFVDDVHDDQTNLKDTVVPIDASENAEEQARSRETIRLIGNALDCLNEDERWAILARSEGANLREIGLHFGHSISWAHTLMQQARAKVKRSLAMHRLDAA